MDSAKRPVGQLPPPGQRAPLPRLLHVFTVAGSLDFLRGQVRFMAGRGFDVHVAAAPEGDLMARFAEGEHATAHAVSMTRTISPATDAISLLRLLSLVRTLRPDIVHAGTPKGGFLGILAAFAHRIPVRIYHMHGIRGLTEVGWRRRLLMTAEWLTCSLSTRVLCVGDSTRASAVAAGLCRPDKIVVLGAGSCNGVDARGRYDPDAIDDGVRAQVRQELKIPANAPVLGFVGRVTRDKGIAELAGAWRLLAALFPDLHLVVVGPTESHDPVPDKILRQLRSDERVRLIAKVTDPARYYAIMDVVTLPTYREGMPTVPLEAAAMRLPVVATAVAGCVDAIVDGVTGTLVPPYSVQALADAIAAYVDSPELCKEHGTSGRERVLRDFIPEQVWERVLGLYQTELRSLRRHRR
ncbi:MAG: glycosyltransferase family 4 protein [Deltaproteobacteria bacterium]|nr:glycosyltransferase family 4 protein [Deltaproteobacteria bacterium]